MRIIAGRLGGRQFLSPRGNKTHPMSDKIRGALFNALGELDGLSVLDAYAGTGALGFEAVSRGAKHVVAIDNDNNAQRTIQENIRELKLGSKVKLIKASVGGWLSTSDSIFDIVLCDPPFDNVQYQNLHALANRVKVHGLLVLSLPPAERFIPDDSFKLLVNKEYGDAVLAFYRRIQ